MADVKIIALPALTAPDDTDVLPIEDVSEPETKKVTVADLRVVVHKVGAETLRIESSKAAADAIVLDAADAVGAVSMRVNGADRLTVTAGGITVIGDITVSGTVDGRDVAADGALLDALPKHNFGAGTLPTTFDDETKGYSVGSRWIVPGAGELVCLDATVGAAVWALVAEANPDPVVEADGSVPMTGALELEAIADPGGEAGSVRIYGKDVGGVTHLHAQSDDGTVHQLTGLKPPIIESGTSRTLTDDDNGRLILTTDTVGPIVITVPALRVGTTVEICQGDGGQVQLVGDTGITLLYPASFLPNTAEQFSSIVVTIVSPTTALVRGDLEAA